MKNKYLKPMELRTMGDLVRMVDHNAQASAKAYKELKKVRKYTGTVLIMYGIASLLHLSVTAMQERRIEELEAKIEILESDLEEHTKE